MSPANEGLRVSVGIAAYNAEANIRQLVCALTSQCQAMVSIVEIIVHSDQSTDRTVAIARENSDPRLLIIDNPRRGGFADSVRRMLSVFKGDAFVLLNDDIRIEDCRFVEKCALPIFHDGADLVGANLQPLAPRTFVEKGFVTTFRIYERIREQMAERNNMFTCDGAALVLSRRLAGAIDFPGDGAQMGNVDAFLFLSCAFAGFRYLHAREAVAWFRSPATLRDYLRRNIRNDSQERILAKRYGRAARSFFRAPRHLYWKSVVVGVARNPLVAAFVFIAGFYIRARSRWSAKRASPTWDVLRSSKELD